MGDTEDLLPSLVEMQVKIGIYMPNQGDLDAGLG